MNETSAAATSSAALRLTFAATSRNAFRSRSKLERKEASSVSSSRTRSTAFGLRPLDASRGIRFRNGLVFFFSTSTAAFETSLVSRLSHTALGFRGESPNADGNGAYCACDLTPVGRVYVGFLEAGVTEPSRLRSGMPRFAAVSANALRAACRVDADPDEEASGVSERSVSTACRVSTPSVETGVSACVRSGASSPGSASGSIAIVTPRRVFFLRSSSHETECACPGSNDHKHGGLAPSSGSDARTLASGGPDPAEPRRTCLAAHRARGRFAFAKTQDKTQRNSDGKGS